ncbi:hypothetical protein [Kineosporia babensis]|uniref:Uncharacterized protein n=1 Tax=Kineosporia babensis TaxID=499548 RepID=A0A9X1NCX5_9ACTN|nr:hypothetical protein [Kineosporia babensis]MCD5312902.1 hypothetical protein [Kineosporia babensis]
MTAPAQSRLRPQPAPGAEPDWALESIRARGAVLLLWHESLGELTDRRGNDPESQALLRTLQFGARPPRHLSGPPSALLDRLRDALSRQIDLIVSYGQLDAAGVEFYRGLQRELDQLTRQPPDPIGLLLERVCDQVHAFYRDATGRPLGKDWPWISWQVLPTRQHPFEAADPYTAGACVVFEDEDAAVRIFVHSQHFGPEAYLSLPAILTHEVFAHVPARPREEHDPSVFTEGFLGWAARVFFEDSCQHVLAGAQALVRQHGRRLMDLQKFAGLVQTDGLSPARRTGHQYAEEVVSWWAQRNPDLAVGAIRLRLAALAARLNVHDGGLTMNDKDELVTALSPRRPAMADALQQYLEHPAGSLEPLLRAGGIHPDRTSPRRTR